MKSLENWEIAVISVSSAIVGICILALMAYLLCRYLKMKDKDFSLRLGRKSRKEMRRVK